MLAGNHARLVLVLGLAIALVACGSGNSIRFASSPTGAFTNASLNGSYAFLVTGTDAGGFFSIAGNLQADGNGNITAGVEDVNSFRAPITNIPISGSYSIGADGRGLAVLNGSIGSITLDFVLISGQSGLVIRFDNNATASGTIDRQDSSAFSAAALAGPFAFSLGGIDVNGASFQNVGAFSADGIASLTGEQDFNDNGTVPGTQTLSGFYSVGANGRGTATFTTAFSGALSFAFYVVDANHLKLIETDSSPVLTGNAFRQVGSFSNTTLSGPYGFTLGGGLAGGSGPFAAGGLFTADGNGNITGGAQDLNINGAITRNVALSGSYAIATSGRGTLVLTNSKTTSSFVIYPSSGGFQMLQTGDTSTSNGVVSSGVALAQQAGPFSNSSIQGNYAYNATGVATSGEIDSIARLAADGNGNFAGAADFNLTGELFGNLAFNGNYSLAANGRGTARLQSSAATQNLALYFLSSSRILFVELDSNLVTVGSFAHQ